MAVRRTRTPVLSVWANGLRVGTWRNPGSAAMEFEYDTAWMNSDAGRPLSLSLDYALGTRKIIRGEAVRHYFDNLLPDSEPIRRRLAMRFGTGSTDAFALLSAIGRDCVGAVQLLGEDEIPVGHDRIEGEPLSDAQIGHGCATPCRRRHRDTARTTTSASRLQARRKRRHCCGMRGNGCARTVPPLPRIS